MKKLFLLLTSLFTAGSMMASTAEEMIFSTDAGFAAITIKTAGASTTGADYEFSKGDVNVTGTYGYINNKKHVVYKSGTMVVKAGGATIDSVKVTYASSCYPFAELLAGSSTTTTKTSSMISATFVPSKADTIVTFSNKSNGKTELKNMTVYYTVVEVPSTPVDTMVHVIVDDPTKCSMKDSHYQVLQLKAGANEVAPGDYALAYPGYNTKYALNEVKLNGVVLQASYNQYYFQSYNNSTLKAGDTLEIKAAYEADSFLVTINTPIEAVVKSAKTVAFDGQYSYTENAVANKLSFKAPAGYPAIIAFENAAYAIDSILVNGVKTELDYNGNIEANVKAATTIQVYAHEKSSAYVKVDNADKAQLRNSSYEYVTLKANEWIQVAEGDYQLATNSSNFSGYALNKVLLNNKEVADNYGYWSLKLSSNDSLEIVANYAVDSFAVVVTDSVAAVKRAATHGKAVATPTSFKAEAGYSVEIELNTTDYKIDSILINGVKQSSTYSISFSARQETTVRVFAHPYGSVSATLKLADPAHVAVCKGTYFNSNDLIANLVAGENTIEVSENNPNIYIKNNAGCIIDSIKNGDAKLNADDNGGYGVTLTQGCKVEVFSHAKVQNNAATIVVKDMASANNNFGLTNALRENVTLAEGENAVKFADDETPFSLSIYGTSIPNVVVYLNGDTVKATYQYDGGANYSSIALANKDYLEIYVNGGKSQYVAEVVPMATLDSVYRASKNDVIEFGDFEVLYVNGKNTYIKDSTAYALIYKENYGLKAGDRVAAGLKGKISIYYNLYEIVPETAVADLKVTEGTASDPEEATKAPTAKDQNQYLRYADVKFLKDSIGTTSTAAKKVSAVCGLDTFTVFNQFLLPHMDFKSNALYTMTGFVSIFNTTVQFYPLSIVEQEPEPVYVTVDLTKEMFHKWTSDDASATIADEAVYPAYDLNKATGLPYGDGNVYYLNYADLTNYKKLIITSTAGAPRCCFNRAGDNGTVTVETPRDAAYFTESEEDGVKTTVVDLEAIVKSAGFAHLLCIKGANWQDVTVTSLKLVKVAETFNVNVTINAIDDDDEATVFAFTPEQIQAGEKTQLAAGNNAVSEGMYIGISASTEAEGRVISVTVNGVAVELDEETSMYMDEEPISGDMTIVITYSGAYKELATYTCAEAIAAYTEETLADNDSIKVTGYISGMFLKPGSFAKYGSVSIWLTDTIGGTAHEFELFNCYGIQGDTLASYSPESDATTNVDVDYVVGRDGTKISLGNKVVAAGKIKKYNSTYELNSGCYLVSVDTSTGIEQLKSENKMFQDKALINKQVIIRRNNKSYNLNGMIVE